MTTSTKVPNRLINEKSPYLLQHANNPVDWYPWGREAFEKARREDKPVFLSIGYSTCHWCHVMAHESFEDETVAALLNRHFVPVKVDREERPDVDHVYMTACTALTGSGGWPLSVFLTPDGRPFYAGTYFPRSDAYGRAGFVTLLKQLAAAWLTDGKGLTRTASKILDSIRETVSYKPAAQDGALTAKAATSFLNVYDSKWGGFGRAPKFPSPHSLMFLMRAAYGESADSPAWRAAGHTLEAIAAGGIRDHIGGGFCRYSTDERWLVPHFEKMLYDNALLCMAYTEYYQKTGQMSEIVRETVTYLCRELADGTGCFYTAQDADSEGHEGLYYVWTPKEISETLGLQDGARFCGLYDITAYGNFEGRSIPNLIGKTLTEDDRAFVSSVLPGLYQKRLSRVKPASDHKIMLTGNALTCAALAKAGRALGDGQYTQMARQCADSMLNTMETESGFIAVRDSRHAATLEGYAYLVWALIEVYENVFEEKYLLEAARVHDMMIERFWEEESGTLYYSEAGDLPMRGINAHDGATPSGQSVAAHNGIRLSYLTGRDEYSVLSTRWCGSLSGGMSTYPQAYAWMLAALLHLEHGGTNVTLVRGDGLPGMLDALRGFRPFMTLRVAEPGPSLTALDGKATAYICTGKTCLPPVNLPEKLKNL